MNFSNGSVDVFEEKLREAGPPRRGFTAEVGKPPVVRLNPGETQFVFFGRSRSRCRDRPRRIEGRRGIREQHLCGDALPVEKLQS